MTGPATQAAAARAALADRLRRRALDAPIPFVDWMRACLYDEGGFYQASTHPAGPAGHFATSVTLHPFFASCIAKELQAVHAAKGQPSSFVVEEHGGGDGHLAHEVLGAAAGSPMGDALRWHIVEAGPRQLDDGAISWTPAPHADVVIAHEFLDALPFRLFRSNGATWDEVAVTWDEGFAPTTVPTSDGPTRSATPGAERAVMSEAGSWLAALRERHPRAPIIIVDYGRDGPDPDPVRTYRDQADAGPWWLKPGTKDITADVDFAWLRDLAASLGYGVNEESQETWLLRHGVLDALNAIPRDSLEGASSYLRLRQLLLPTGWGARFRVVRLTP